MTPARRVACRYLSVCAFVLPLVPATGGGDVAAQAAVVARNVNLRAGPSTGATIIRLLHPPDELIILDPTKVNGYYEVRSAGGSEGWVWSNNVHITGPAAADTTTGPPEIYRGCLPEGSAQQEFRRQSNRRKNRVTAPAPGDIDSAATLAALLATGDDRTRWSDARGASIVAYVVDVKRGGEETVNCGETDVRHRDTHIDVVLHPDTSEPKTVRLVVEVTPRWRVHMAQQGRDWSTAALEQALERRWVRFTGWLFYDLEHADEAENTNPGGDWNWRRTAWEVHPVTAIRVCPGSPQDCD